MFLIDKHSWETRMTAEKGLGIYAKKEIKKGTVIGDYLGKAIKTEEYDLDLDKKGLYLMYLTDEASIYPNFKKPDLHLINHSCTPNCWIYIYKGHTLFFAIKDISPKDELTISYLLAPKDKSCLNCSHVCKCDSKNCTKTMHLSEVKYQKWQDFQKSETDKTRRPKVIFSKDLPKLTHYPMTIPINSIYAEISE